jgi:hypothetical protein
MLNGLNATRLLSPVFLISSVFSVAIMIGRCLGSMDTCTALGIPDVGDSLVVNPSGSRVIRVGTEVQSSSGKLGVCAFELKCLDSKVSTVSDCIRHQGLPHSFTCWTNGGYPSCVFPWDWLVLPTIVGLVSLIAAIAIRVFSNRQSSSE